MVPISLFIYKDFDFNPLLEALVVAAPRHRMSPISRIVDFNPLLEALVVAAGDLKCNVVARGD